MAQTSPRLLAIFGAGGFGREVLQIAFDIEDALPGTWKPVSFLVDPGYAEVRGEARLPISDHLDLLRSNEDILVVIAVGSPGARRAIAERLAWLPDHRFATLVHPTAYVSRVTTLGPGTIVCAAASTTTDVRAGRHVQVHAGARIGHDTQLGDFASIYPGAVIAGHVYIGQETEVGAGSVVNPGLKVGSRAVLGAGSVVIRSLADAVVAVGNPARVIKKRADVDVSEFCSDHGVRPD